MEINIISYTDAQYASFTEEQIQEVKSAQLQKNRLELALEEAKLKEKHRLIDRGIFLSGVWEAYCDKLQAQHDQKIESLRDSLLFYLHFSTKPESGSTGYTVDYSLPVEERVAIVKSYYESTYKNADECFEAFKADNIAVVYLDELYAAVYDYFLNKTL